MHTPPTPRIAWRREHRRPGPPSVRGGAVVRGPESARLSRRPGPATFPRGLAGDAVCSVPHGSPRPRLSGSLAGGPAPRGAGF